ncbi:unnamed protein product [Merluccius merluccius]
MAEQRRSGGSPGVLVPPAEAGPSGPSGPSRTSRAEGDRRLLAQLGVGELLRGAVLKMVEARSDDPVGFLADHFCHLASGSDPADRDPPDRDRDAADGEQGACAQERQHLHINRALWHLRSAHHSHRSAFSNNVLLAYDLLSDDATAAAAPQSRPSGAASEGPAGDGGGGGVRGGPYTQTLRCLCGEGGVPASTSAPLLRRLRCRDHEAVPYDLFRQGALTCAVFSDYIRRAQRLYAEVCGPAEGPASRALCRAVLGTLREALETSRGGEAERSSPDAAAAKAADPGLEANPKANRYLEASAKMSPYKVARVMAQGARADAAGGHMDAKEFEDAAAELFIARVRVVS